MDEECRAEFDRVHGRITRHGERIVALETQQPHTAASLPRIEKNLDRVVGWISKAAWVVVAAFMSEAEYHAALTKLIEGVVGTASERAGNREIAHFLAGVWDPIVGHNIIQTILVVDSAKQMSVLEVMSGRMKYGRPVGIHGGNGWRKIAIRSGGTMAENRLTEASNAEEFARLVQPLVEQHKSRLEARRKEARALFRKDDWGWRIFIVSFATLGGSKNWDRNHVAREAEYTWSKVSNLTDSDRKKLFWQIPNPHRKKWATYLESVFQLVKAKGGPDGVRQEYESLLTQMIGSDISIAFLELAPNTHETFLWIVLIRL